MALSLIVCVKVRARATSKCGVGGVTFKVKVRMRLKAQNHEGWRLVMNAWGCNLLKQPRQPKVPYGLQLAASRYIY